jgi:hypothetical protein
MKLEPTYFPNCLKNTKHASTTANIYGELSFLVGFCQNNYDAMQLKEKDPNTYNFYKNSNISERNSVAQTGARNYGKRRRNER